MGERWYCSRCNAYHREDGPIEGRWYWVKIGELWSTAMHTKKAAGGWTNMDTWEDWDNEVDECKLIPLPNEIDEQEDEYQEAVDRLGRLIYSAQYTNALEIIDKIGSLVGWDKLAAYAARKQQQSRANG